MRRIKVQSFDPVAGRHRGRYRTALALLVVAFAAAGATVLPAVAPAHGADTPSAVGERGARAIAGPAVPGRWTLAATDTATVLATDTPVPTATSTDTAVPTPQPTGTAIPRPTGTAIPRPTGTAIPRPTGTAIPRATGTVPPPAPATPTVTPIPRVPALQVLGPGGAEGPLAALIGGARHRVLVEAFRLDDGVLLAALQSAHQRGVDVRVMLDQVGLGSTATLTTLRNAGIRTRLPNSGTQNAAYAVTHQNVVVVDVAAVVVSTAPFAPDALGPAGSGFVVIDHDPFDVLQGASLFYDDWLRRPVTLFGHNLVVLPDNAPSIAGLIGTAAHRIELYTAAVIDPSIVAALDAARARGVVVRVLGHPGANVSSLQQLARGGTVRQRDEGPGTVLVVDRATAMLGSMDLAASTLTGNREVGVLLGGTAVVAPVDAAFFTWFAQGTVVTRPVPVVIPRGHPRPGRNTYPFALGRLHLGFDLPSFIAIGTANSLTVTGAPGAAFAVSITYPVGSRPGGTTASGASNSRSSYTARWTVPRTVRTGLAQVRIDVRTAGSATPARYIFQVAVA